MARIQTPGEAQSEWPGQSVAQWQGWNHHLQFMCWVLVRGRDTMASVGGMQNSVWGLGVMKASGHPRSWHLADVSR